MTRASLLLGLSFLTACGNKIPENAVQLEWAQGDLFHVGARYRVGDAMTEEVPASLDGGEPVFGENWTDEVVWSYQVVETGLVPDEGDELYEYAETHDGVAALSVVRAWVDASYNDDPALLASDPVIYLVFREDRDRLAAVISFTTAEGERGERAFSSHELGRSWSALSQSMLTAAPTYLAPWSAAYENGSKTLENGSEMSTALTDDETVDVAYEDELGGGLVVSRYEKGAPWPTWTVSDNVEARLLSGTEVEAKRRPYMAVAVSAPDDFDYRAALASSVDIDSALTLDADTMDDGFEDEVYEEYQPWAGSWWRLSEAALVFGYDGRDTISDRIQADVDPLKRELDTLSTDIRKLSDGADKDAKVATYKEKQTALVQVLVTFYDGVRQDLDGGRLTIADGKITHVDGWSYDLDELSPMDKLALQLHASGHTSPNPFYLPAWELLNHYNPAGGSWWGHCNGWSAAAILTNEPTESVSVDLNGQTVKYTTADIKGLLSESHYSTDSRFYGQRYDGETDDITDLTPAAFHKLASFYLREQGVPMVFDTTADEEVWNFPAWALDMDVTETTAGGDAGLVNVNTATAAELEELPGVGETLAGRIVEYRELNGPFQTKEALMDVKGIGQGTYDDLADKVTVTTTSGERTFSVSARVTLATDGVSETHVDDATPESSEETWAYTLVTDANGQVLRGTWTDEKHHPDFAWVPYENPLANSSGGSENPYLGYDDLLDVIGKDFERK